ncbi:ArnT family glycosyltransferase [Candidatus Leptofilum sp.]|uniref:ArnT family glycosyltransferase n=1 Tax=Candidatus Leptofilum sp. TaxID=3241576 RepID=UPI003B5C6370
MKNLLVICLNGLLILLYVWALGEETAVSVQVSNGRCVAIVPERHIGIDCPQVGAGSQVGLLATQPATTGTMLASYPPLRWLAPHTAWGDLNLFTPDGQPIWRRPFGQMAWEEWQLISGGWQTRWGELHGLSSQNSLVLREPVGDSFILTSSLRRAEDEAGLLLLHPDGHTGLVFILDGENRRGVWWEWENGRPTNPLIGIPFQKPFMEQAKTLLRLLLTGHQAALLLLGIMWGIKKAGTQRGTEKAQRFTEKISNLESPISPKIAVVFLTFLTFALTAHIASDVLARVPHVQDSLTYLFQAQTLARGKLWAEAPPLPEFFEQEFLLVQNGRWFGKYPPGFPALLALGVLLNASWLINPLLATLTVPLLYQLGRRMGNGRTGLVAAGLMSLSPFFLFLSGSHMAHAAELFWLSLFMVCWWVVIKESHRGTQRNKRLGLALAAGLAAGMAFLTRQLTAVAIVAPFFLLTIWHSPLPWHNRLQRGAVWLAGLLPLVALLFVYQWAVTGDPLQDPRLLYWPFDQLGFGDDVGEAPNLLEIAFLDEEPGYAVLWRTDPSQPLRGHTPQRGLHNILRNWQVLQTDLFGWLPLLTFTFLWLGFMLKLPTRADWILLATLVSLVAAEAFYWHAGIMYGPRYLYGALPALLLLTARGAQVLAGWLGRRWGWRVTAVLLTLLILGNLLTLPSRMEGYRGFNFVVGDKVALVETLVPSNAEGATPPDEQALIFVDSPTGNWWEYGELFMGNEVMLADGRLVFARNLGHEENQSLLKLYPNHTPYLFANGQLMPLMKS